MAFCNRIVAQVAWSIVDEYSSPSVGQNLVITCLLHIDALTAWTRPAPVGVRVPVNCRVSIGEAEDLENLLAASVKRSPNFLPTLVTNTTPYGGC